MEIFKEERRCWLQKNLKLIHWTKILFFYVMKFCKKHDAENSHWAFLPAVDYLNLSFSDKLFYNHFLFNGFPRRTKGMATFLHFIRWIKTGIVLLYWSKLPIKRLFNVQKHREIYFYDWIIILWIYLNKTLSQKTFEFFCLNWILSH